MTFSRIRPANMWTPNSVVEPHEFEQIDRNLARAVDGYDGGAIAPNNPIEIGGAGLQVAYLDGPPTDQHVVNVASQRASLNTVRPSTLCIPPTFVLNSADLFEYSPVLHLRQKDVSAAGSIPIPFNIPHTGVRLVSARARILGYSGHSSLPATMPRFALYERRADNTGVVLQNETADTAADIIAYQSLHDITLNFGGTPVNVNADSRYYAVFRGETGDNSVVGLLLTHILLDLEPIPEAP